MKQGECQGNYDESESACQKCMAAVKCQDVTWRLKAEKKRKEESGETEPLGYLLSVLRQVDGVEESVEENKSAVAHNFRKDGKLVFSVACSKSTGRFRVASSKTKVMVEKLETIGTVDRILAELMCDVA